MPFTYKYPRPCVTVDCIVFRPGLHEPEVLLIRRGQPPHEGMWAFPGGFVNMDETLEEAATRELNEETGLDRIHLRQLKAFSAINRDPRARTIAVAFIGMADPEDSEVQGMDDAAEARWFPVSAVPKLAFDHEEMLFAGLEQVN